MSKIRILFKNLAGHCDEGEGKLSSNESEGLKRERKKTKKEKTKFITSFCSSCLKRKSGKQENGGRVGQEGRGKKGKRKTGGGESKVPNGHTLVLAKENRRTRKKSQKKGKKRRGHVLDFCCLFGGGRRDVEKGNKGGRRGKGKEGKRRRKPNRRPVSGCLELKINLRPNPGTRERALRKGEKEKKGGGHKCPAPLKYSVLLGWGGRKGGRGKRGKGNCLCLHSSHPAGPFG